MRSLLLYSLLRVRSVKTWSGERPGENSVSAHLWAGESAQRSFVETIRWNSFRVRDRTLPCHLHCIVGPPCLQSRAERLMSSKNMRECAKSSCIR